MNKEVKPRIYVDIREEKSGIPKLLSELGAIVVSKKLDMGDYLVSEDTVIERKSVGDFASSLFDGRLFDQARRMSESYNNIIYVVEGNPNILLRWRGRSRQVQAALVTLVIDFDARILWSDNEATSAYIIYSIAKRMQTQLGGARIVIRKKPKLQSIRDWQLYILQAFPGIGPKLAQTTLEYMGTIERFCRASVTELSRIPGFGEKRAETIRRILITPFKKESRRRTVNLEEFLSQDNTMNEQS